jgi:spore maturation protein CgeB
MWRPKSILVAGPVSHDSTAENIVYTLQKEGISPIYNKQLTQERYANRWRKIKRELLQKALHSYIPPEERWLVKVAREYRPEVFLAPVQVIQEETLRDLKRAGVRACVAWWGDPPGNMHRMGLLSPDWDLIFFKDPDAVTKFRRVGLNAHLLHEAFNPAWHRPVAQQANENVVVAGNFYGYRQFLVLRLMEQGVKVALYGGKLPRWVHPEIRRIHTGQYIVRDEKSRVFGEALACLNSTQMIEGNSLNMRAFEIAGAGGLHLMEYKPIISECFEPGKEVLTFDSLDELLEHIERARRFPGEMEKIREAAARRAHSEHTYKHRLEKIFAKLQGA